MLIRNRPHGTSPARGGWGRYAPSVARRRHALDHSSTVNLLKATHGPYGGATRPSAAYGLGMSSFWPTLMWFGSVILFSLLIAATVTLYWAAI